MPLKSTSNIFYLVIVLCIALLLSACGGRDTATPTAAPQAQASATSPPPATAVPTELPATAAPTERPATATSAPTPTGELQPAYTPLLEERACQTYNPPGDVEGETYRCGVMIVPQNRGEPGGVKIEIKYAILRSLSDNPLPDPMLFLSGGPGNSALYPDGFVELASRFSPMRGTRDIILFDQRGVGMSAPVLECATVPLVQDEKRKAELLAKYVARTGVEPNEENQGTVDCVLSLWNQGVELSHYTSAASAADTVDLMRALDYQGYNLYGISYGTRLAETIARDYPDLDLIRTITLDSVFPRPVGEFDAAYYIGKHERFEYVFQACAADGACNGAYPNLNERFFALKDKLDTEPLKLPDETTFSGADLYQQMFPFQDRGPGWIPLIPYLPRMIAELEEGKTDTLMGIRNGTLVPSTSPEVPDSVYDVMDKLSNCTAITDEEVKNDRYRQMYNASRERVVELANELCTPDEAQPILDQLENMTTEHVNEVVKRLFLTPVRSSSGWVRTQFNCNEALPFGESAETVESKMRDAGMPQFLIDEAVETVNRAAKTCREWPSGTAPVFENETVSSGYRTLILNGEFDYVTYPKWAAAVHGRWSNSHYVLAPNSLHSLLSNYGLCLTDITLRFLENPAVAPDSSCTGGMKIEWVMPES